jgi:hypothetical protein
MKCHRSQLPAAGKLPGHVYPAACNFEEAPRRVARISKRFEPEGAGGRQYRLDMTVDQQTRMVLSYLLFEIPRDTPLEPIRA